MLQVELDNILTEEDALGKIQDIFHKVEDENQTYIITKSGRPAVAIISVEKLEQHEGKLIMPPADTPSPIPAQAPSEPSDSLPDLPELSTNNLANATPSQPELPPFDEKLGSLNNDSSSPLEDIPDSPQTYKPEDVNESKLNEITLNGLPPLPSQPPAANSAGAPSINPGNPPASPTPPANPSAPFNSLNLSASTLPASNPLSLADTPTQTPTQISTPTQTNSPVSPIPLNNPDPTPIANQTNPGLSLDVNLNLPDMPEEDLGNSSPLG